MQISVNIVNEYFTVARMAHTVPKGHFEVVKRLLQYIAEVSNWCQNGCSNVTEIVAQLFLRT